MSAERVLICGDRHWTDMKLIYTLVEALPPDTIVIHGAGGEADELAGKIADSLGLATFRIPAQWKRYGGKRAGPIRNQRMLDEGKPSIVVAFHNHLPGSKGTKDMVLKARLAGIPVQLYNDQGKLVEVTDDMFTST